MQGRVTLRDNGAAACVKRPDVCQKFVHICGSLLIPAPTPEQRSVQAGISLIFNKPPFFNLLLGGTPPFSGARDSGCHGYETGPCSRYTRDATVYWSSSWSHRMRLSFVICCMAPIFIWLGTNASLRKPERWFIRRGAALWPIFPSFPSRRLSPDFRRAYTHLPNGRLGFTKIELTELNHKSLALGSQNMFTIRAQAVEDTQKTELARYSVAMLLRKQGFTELIEQTL